MDNSTKKLLEECSVASMQDRELRAWNRYSIM